MYRWTLVMGENKSSLVQKGFQIGEVKERLGAIWSLM